MTTFIDEFQLSDLTLCDSILKMFDDAHDRGLTFAGQSGAMGQARPEIKASTDFWLNDCDKLGPPEKYRWPEYQAELNGFIDQYLEKYNSLSMEVCLRLDIFLKYNGINLVKDITNGILMVHK